MAELAGLESVFSLGHRARTAVFLLRLPEEGARTSIWSSNEIQLSGRFGNRAIAAGAKPFT